MYKKLIGVTECKNGDILAEDIVNSRGATVIGMNTVINDAIKSKLIGMGMTRVKIFLKTLDEEEKQDNIVILKKTYSKNMSDVNELINDMALGKKFDAVKVNTVTENVYNSLENESSMIKCMAELKSADEYTYTHSVNVSFYAMLIGKWMKMGKEDLKDIVKAGILHDVGKAKVPISVLNKPGKLLPEEFGEIKKHTSYGFESIKDIKELSNEVKMTALMHHEKEDGSGYPSGVKGDDINLFSKIVTIADIYDAITSNRAYSQARTPFEAFEILESSGMGTLNPEILSLFLNNIIMFYLGERVQLNTGETGEIVHIPPHSISKPLIRVQDKILDLSKKTDIKVIKML